MSKSNRLARSAAIASSALLFVVGGSFAHDASPSGGPAGSAASPARWAEDDDRQATDFIPPAPDADDDQGDDNEQGDDNDQGTGTEATHVHKADTESDHLVAAKPAKAKTKTADSADENDDDQGEDATDDADDQDGEHDDADNDDGDHQDGDHEDGTGHDDGDGGGDD